MAEAGHVRHDGCYGRSAERVVFACWWKTILRFEIYVFNGHADKMCGKGPVGVLRTYHIFYVYLLS